jgi:hypothetical protein
MAAASLEVARLPGHSPNQVGIGHGGVLFCGDAVFSSEVHSVKQGNARVCSGPRQNGCAGASRGKPV